MNLFNEENLDGIRVTRAGVAISIAPPFAVYLEFRAGRVPDWDSTLKYAEQYMLNCVYMDFPDGLFTIPWQAFEELCPRMNHVLAIHSGSSKEEIIEAAKSLLENEEDVAVEAQPGVTLPMDLVV